MQYTALAILIVGIIALLVEILMPGFGFFGISGLVLLIISGVLTILFVENGVYIVSIGFVIFIVFGGLIIQAIKKRGSYKKIILEEAVGNDVDPTEKLEGFVGKTGVVKTPLRPNGNVKFGDEIVDVFSDGDFISAGENVVATKVYEGKLYVTLKEDNK